MYTEIKIRKNLIYFIIILRITFKIDQSLYHHQSILSLTDELWGGVRILQAQATLIMSLVRSIWSALHSEIAIAIKVYCISEASNNIFFYNILKIWIFNEEVCRINWELMCKKKSTVREAMSKRSKKNMVISPFLPFRQ